VRTTALRCVETWRARVARAGEPTGSMPQAPVPERPVRGQ
jgi:hypothetical protein